MAADPAGTSPEDSLLDPSNQESSEVVEEIVDVDGGEP
jgi:hypothetical protein